MQVPILNGIVTDPEAPDVRTAYPRNQVPVVKPNGISNGYLRPAEGIELLSDPGLGGDRGGIAWNGRCFRVLGPKLVEVFVDGSVDVIGEVGGIGHVSIDYSFDRLGVASGGRLFYAVGVPFQEVTDTNLGVVVDAMFISGYWFFTDGENLVVTELNNPGVVLPLKYGSSELDPDPVVGVLRLRDEAYAINRYTIEGFRNVGGANFPFQVIPGSRILRGAVGTHAKCRFEDGIAFVGSGRNEAISVYLGSDGSAAPIATREIEQLLEEYSEAALAEIVVEWVVLRGHSFLFVHLPDQCLVYDTKASLLAKEAVWHTRDSGAGSSSLRYAARDAVFCFDRWIVGDPTTGRIGVWSDQIASHFGQLVGWEFATLALYMDGNEAQIHEFELVALPGRVALGENPVIWASHSADGVVWSAERPIAAGKIGDRQRRLLWLQGGLIKHYRIQRFRGNSDAPVAFIRLELRIEPLNSKRSRGG